MREIMKVLLAALLLLPTLAFGTAQQADVLLYEGKMEPIFSTPLEEYFSANNNRPDWLTETNTACWRGYAAQWELREDRLYLTKVIRGDYVSAKAKLVETDISKKLFPKQSLPIEATWFTGVIRVPQGKQLEYVHMGFESVYEKDRFLHFENGVLTKVQVKDNRPSRAPKAGVNK